MRKTPKFRKFNRVSRKLGGFHSDYRPTQVDLRNSPKGIVKDTVISAAAAAARDRGRPKPVDTPTPHPFLTKQETEYVSYLMQKHNQPKSTIDRPKDTLYLTREKQIELEPLIDKNYKPLLDGMMAGKDTDTDPQFVNYRKILTKKGIPFNKMLNEMRPMRHKLVRLIIERVNLNKINSGNTFTKNMRATNLIKVNQRIKDIPHETNIESDIDQNYNRLLEYCKTQPTEKPTEFESLKKITQYKYLKGYDDDNLLDDMTFDEFLKTKLNEFLKTKLKYTDLNTTSNTTPGIELTTLTPAQTPAPTPAPNGPLNKDISKIIAFMLNDRLGRKHDYGLDVSRIDEIKDRLRENDGFNRLLAHLADVNAKN